MENALAAYYAAQPKQNILVEAVQANEEAMALASERYRRGLTRFLDVLKAQRSLSQSQANLLTHLVALYKALGGGWSAAEVSPDPRRHRGLWPREEARSKRGRNFLLDS